MNDPMVPSIYRVENYIKDTHDTFTLELTPEDRGGRFFFQPGQFNMLYAFGVGEVPISISGDPLSPLPIRHTTRIVGNVTRHLGNLKAGDTLGVRGPFGSRWPLEEAEGKDVVIVAGGIGLAPLRPLIYQLSSQRKKHKRIILLYGARTPRDILYHRELKSLSEKFDVDVTITVDKASRAWRGNVGVVPALIPRIRLDPDTAVAYLCGPEVMMNFAVMALAKQGIREENIYLSMERNMKCAVGFCGHCQYGPFFVCKDGPVFRYDRIKRIFRIEEI